MNNRSIPGNNTCNPGAASLGACFGLVFVGWDRWVVTEQAIRIPYRRFSSSNECLSPTST